MQIRFELLLNRVELSDVTTDFPISPRVYVNVWMCVYSNEVDASSLLSMLKRLERMPRGE